MHHILQHDIKEPILTSLTTLRLKLIDLGMSYKAIFSSINFANLRMLSLIGVLYQEIRNGDHALYGEMRYRPYGLRHPA